MITSQIGDNKLPNKYWVSVFEDYYYNEGNVYNWISNRDKDFKGNGKTLKVFKTYKEAKDYFNSISLRDTIQGIGVMGKSIEDRITGQLCEEVIVEAQTCLYCKHTREEDYFYTEDLDFTKKKMAQKGINFV